MKVEHEGRGLPSERGGNLYLWVRTQKQHEPGKVTQSQTGLECLAMNLNLLANRASVKGHTHYKDGHLDVSAKGLQHLPPR